MRRYSIVAVLVSLACLAGERAAQAAIILSENFNSPTGHTINANQATTLFPVAFGGNVASWSKTGFNAIHFVDRGSGNWSPMFFNGPANNVITSPSVALGNATAQRYAITFDLAPAVYNGLSQATVAGDGIVVDVLNSANVVIASRTYYPPPFASVAAAGSLPYTTQTMYYSGNGSGTQAASLRFSSTTGNSGHFGGAIDNTALDTISSLPFGAVLFSENFNNPTGANFPGVQLTTGLGLVANGNLAGWTKGGAGTIHFVNRGGGNQAAMFYEGPVGQPGNNNIITTAPFGAGNLLGTRYTVSFELAPGQYQTLSQATGVTDGLTLQVLDSLNNIIAQQTFLPGSFASQASPGNLPFQLLNMTYFGNGFGDGSAHLAIFGNNAGQDRFAGSIDNLLVATAAPEPTTLAVWAVAACGVLAFARRKFRRGQRL